MHPWQRLAKIQNLKFIPGDFLREQPKVQGQFRGYNLRLTDRIIGMEITLSQALPTNIDFNNHPIVPDDIKSLLGSPKLTSLVDGYVRAEANGQKFYYHQIVNSEELKYDVRRVQKLINQLCDLADDYRFLNVASGKAVFALETLALQNGGLPKVACQLLRDIERNTTERLGHKYEHLLCPFCIVRCHKHLLEIPDVLKINYYGCRACGQSDEFLEFKGQIIAQLNSQLKEEQYLCGAILRVNWLINRRICDFDWVEIIQATDIDVEKFAVQVGNDTDEIRKRKYERMRCIVSSDCKLSVNTLRILHRIFEKVEIKKL